jgi:hypothetical protein
MSQSSWATKASEAVSSHTMCDHEHRGIYHYSKDISPNIEEHKGLLYMFISVRSSEALLRVLVLFKCLCLRSLARP